MRLLLLCLFFSLGFKIAFAQDPTATQMNWYGQAKSSSNLFIHFDKNIYANNETVWFTAYLLKQSSISIDKHQVLAVSLVKDVDSSIVVQNKFLIQNGIAFGNLVIPDSLITGDYHLMAHTDIIVNGKPDAFFLQPITIKTNIEPFFKASMKLIKAATLKESSNQVLLAVTSKGGSFLPKPTTINYKYGNLTINAKTDASGQLLMNLPLQRGLEDPNLYVKLKYQKDSSFINIPLPTLQQKANVMFYPEGGNMVEGLPNTIGWEVKDQHHMPLATYAFLYRNNEVIDTIETNSYGLGKFNLIPQNGAIYTVKLQHSEIIDSVYQIAAPLPKGLVMHMPNAIVVDTLQFNLRSNDIRKFFIRIHNFRESYINIPFDMEYYRRNVKIPINELPKGLAAITISDSTGKPLAERIFFAHYSNDEQINLKTDQSTYKQREKVTLKLNLNTDQKEAVVSIACVQDNRVELKKMNDIESFTYINSELSQLPIHNKGNAYSDKNYLEQVLLIKGWRRYHWKELNEIIAADTLKKVDSLRIVGQIKRSAKDLTKFVEISTFGSDNFNLFQTSTTGHFTLENEQLFTSNNKPILLFVNNSNRTDYDFKINDAYLDFTNDLAKQLTFGQRFIPSTRLNNAELLLKNDEKSIRLKEVTILAKKDNSFNFGLPGRNPCGDYVCKFNILNCPNHANDFENTQPIAGRSYMVNGNSQVYLACRKEPEVDKFAKINGIHLHKEFYVDDYKEPQEPAFFSTIYWNYATILNANKETELSFYTSDITGRFRIVAQGITNKDVVYAEQFFEVRK